MLNLLQAELFKLKKSTAFKVCFLLCCCSATALVVISNFIAVGKLDKSISGNASGLTEICIISLLGSLMAGILVSSDFETKTIHSMVASGNGRRAVAYSKVVIFVLIIVLLILPYLIVTLIGVCSGVKFTSPFVPSIFIQYLYDTMGKTITVDVIAKIILISLSAMLVHAARLSICILVAFKIRKSIAVLAFGFVFNGVIDLLLGLLKDVPVISDLIKYTPFSKDFLLVSVHSGTGVFLRAIISSIIFLVIIMEVAYQLFKKAEIK
jgi:hypothetical protein